MELSKATVLGRSAEEQTADDSAGNQPRDANIRFFTPKLTAGEPIAREAMKGTHTSMRKPFFETLSTHVAAPEVQTTWPEVPAPRMNKDTVRNGHPSCPLPVSLKVSVAGGAHGVQKLKSETVH